MNYLLVYYPLAPGYITTSNEEKHPKFRSTSLSLFNHTHLSAKYPPAEIMSFWVPAPEPESPLARYRVLSPNAAVRVSPLQLGAMSIGDKWAAAGMGAMDASSRITVSNLRACMSSLR